MPRHFVASRLTQLLPYGKIADSGPHTRYDTISYLPCKFAAILGCFRALSAGR